MNNTIEHLLQDHRDIMAQVADLRKAVTDLAARGEAALPNALPVFRHIGHMLATQLVRHAQKEDEALFPALENIIGAVSGPTRVMRREHQAIHAQGELLRQTLHEVTEVEHPQIETGREKLKELVAHGAEAATLRQNAEDLIQLLDLHFAKEEQILFPMAENMLDDETWADVNQRMKRLV